MDTSKSISAWHMINMHYRPCIENVEFKIIIKIRTSSHCIVFVHTRKLSLLGRGLGIAGLSYLQSFLNESPQQYGPTTGSQEIVRHSSLLIIVCCVYVAVGNFS